MLFQKKQKKKLDPKIRFQHSSFTKQVKDASSYKRQQRTIPETPVEKMFASFGLESWPRKIGVLSVLFFLIYLVFIPNLFFLQKVEIEGLAERDVPEAERIIREYTQERQIFPQRHLFFLNTERLGDVLIARSNSVLKIKAIEKRYPNSLHIVVEPKIEVFTLETAAGSYVMFNNGVVSRAVQKNEQGQNAEIKGMLVKTAYDNSLLAGKHYVSDRFVRVVQTLRAQFKGIVQYDVQHVEVEPETKVAPPTVASPEQPAAAITEAPATFLSEEKPIDPLEITVIAAQPNASNPYTFKIYFDVQSVTAERFEKVSLLLQQFTEEKRASIAYIDMRFKNKGYVCFKGTACASSPRPVEAQSEAVQENKINNQ